MDTSNRILIIGGSGVIGYQFVKFFSDNKFEVDYTYLKNKPPETFGISHNLDIIDRKCTLELFDKVKPDIVIHTSALTNVDLCQRDHEIADAINVDGTRNIVDGCKKSQCKKLVFISTSFVFDGKKEEYFEDDEIFPSTYYGKTKGDAEKIVLSSKLEHLILRTDQPYCWKEDWQHTNSVLRVLETLREGKIMKEVTDWYNTPTYVPEFVKVTHKLLELNQIGIFHVVGSDFISRYEWSKITAKVFGLDEKMIESIHSGSLNLEVDRPNVNLINEKVSKVIGLKMNGIKNGITKMLQEKIS